MPKKNGMNAVRNREIREMIQKAWSDARMLESRDFVMQTPFDETEWLVGIRPLNINYGNDHFFSEDPFAILDPTAAVEILGSYLLMIMDVIERGSERVPSELGIPFYSVSRFLEEELSKSRIRSFSPERLTATREVLKCLIESRIKRLNRKQLSSLLCIIDAP